MRKILLCTLNARYIHSAFGLRCLYANLGELQSQSEILEFTISQDPRKIAETILSKNPKIVGWSVYIWNTTETEKVIRILKQLDPTLIIILGGPEVSYETETQSICQLADHTLCGEADIQFKDLCWAILQNPPIPHSRKIQSLLPDLSSLHSPYPYYTDQDIKNRVLYVEASRGCPYKCEYCLSSLDSSVRAFPLTPFLNEMEKLIHRGARQFKFIDRTFNLKISTSIEILEFFLKFIDLGIFLHFEMVPDRLPDELKEILVKFPPGSLQFEIGIQTWNENVSETIRRKNNFLKVRENFKFLKEKTTVHLHADLIAGLPGETLESFGKGFDEVLSLQPHEIQVGVLKKLRGTPIARHTENFKMCYQEHPPYLVLSTSTMSFSEVQKMLLFSRFWDQMGNSGHFKNSILFLKNHCQKESSSFFQLFYELTLFLEKRYPEAHSISLYHLVESLSDFMQSTLKMDPNTTEAVLQSDYPQWKNQSAKVSSKKKAPSPAPSTPVRQKRHH